MTTGTGLSSVMIVGLTLSPVGSHYFIMFYISGMLSVAALFILLVFYKQERFKPDWSQIFLDEQEAAAVINSVEARV